MNIALTNATVVPCTGEQPLERATVVVEGDRIAWVGLSADAPENGAEQVDCTGKTILPGSDRRARAPGLLGGAATRTASSCRSRSRQAAVDAALNAALLLRLGFTSIRDVGTRGNIAVIIRDAIAARPPARVRASRPPSRSSRSGAASATCTPPTSSGASSTRRR